MEGGIAARLGGLGFYTLLGRKGIEEITRGDLRIRSRRAKGIAIIVEISDSFVKVNCILNREVMRVCKLETLKYRVC